MNDLDPQARAIIEAARDADEPSLADRDRIKRVVLLQVAAGAVGAAASTAVAGTMTVGMTVGMKVGLTVLAVSLAGGGAAGLAHWHGSHHASKVGKQAPTRIAPVRSTMAAPAEIPTIPPPIVVAPSPKDSKARVPENPRKVAAQNDHDGERVTEEDPVNAEVAVLKRAREELRLGRPARALDELREFDRRFGQGVLGEERQAMAAIAACQARPGPRARAQAQAFLRSSPHSPLLERVRVACLTDETVVSP